MFFTCGCALYKRNEILISFFFFIERSSDITVRLIFPFPSSPGVHKNLVRVKLNPGISIDVYLSAMLQGVRFIVYLTYNVSCSRA